jgi:hypothetical protein
MDNAMAERHGLFSLSLCCLRKRKRLEMKIGLAYDLKEEVPLDREHPQDAPYLEELPP